MMLAVSQTGHLLGAAVDWRAGGDAFGVAGDEAAVMRLKIHQRHAANVGGLLLRQWQCGELFENDPLRALAGLRCGRPTPPRMPAMVFLAAGDRAAGEAEAMHLAEHGASRDAAELHGDLAAGEPVSPKPLERFNALVCPGWVIHASPAKAPGRDQVTARARPGSCWELPALCWWRQAPTQTRLRVGPAAGRRAVRDAAGSLACGAFV